MTFGPESWDNRIKVFTNSVTDVTSGFVSARINSGSNFGPYKSGPQVASATVNFFYASGVTIPASIAVQSILEIKNQYLSGATFFNGRIRDVNITYVRNNALGTWGQQVTCFVTDRVADFEAVAVSGISTSSATKNETWEQRLTNTLQPYFPLGSAIFPSTASEAHIYRLVDNNVTGSLVDQVNLACDSVGATWSVSGGNNFAQFFAKGVYPKTGILFSDEASYWNAGNRPANAGTIWAENVGYSDIEVSRDTRELVNRINVNNVMPRNIVLSNLTAGALLYKDPVTAHPEDLQVIQPTYQGQDATSISTYGVRAQDIQTNVYPYRTTDTESFYVQFNGYQDGGLEYRSNPQVFSTNANVRLSNVTPQTGTWCLDVVTTTSGASYVLVLGDPNGYLLKTLPPSNTNCFNLSWRTAQANARFQRGIQYLDSNGNVLLTQSGGLNTPTLNTWTTQGAVFMDYTAIPAGTVTWRPIFTITHATGNFAVGTTIAKLDDITINPDMQQQVVFTGDTPDTTSNLCGWEYSPGQSWSYRQRNVLDNIATDVLTYWKDNSLKPRFIKWNARLSWGSIYSLQPLGRVDIRFKGTNYVAFVNSYTIDIDADNCVISAELGYRPSSWN